VYCITTNQEKEQIRKDMDVNEYKRLQQYNQTQMKARDSAFPSFPHPTATAGSSTMRITRISI